MLERLQEFQTVQDLPATPVPLPESAHWIPLRSPTLKVNFDCAIFHNSQTAGIGVVIRDYSGKAVGALSERIPLPSTVDVAEALACRRAVSFAKELGIKSVIVEGDSEKVIKSMNMDPPCLAPLNPLAISSKTHKAWRCTLSLSLFLM